jgi:retron-type reverse transcriptase
MVTQQGLSEPFATHRGIRQGCPVSPILFSILLSGLERRLLRLHPNLGLTLQQHNVVLSSYADDIKLFGSSLHDINALFTTTQSFLR